MEVSGGAPDTTAGETDTLNNPDLSSSGQPIFSSAEVSSEGHRIILNFSDVVGIDVYSNINISDAFTVQNNSTGTIQPISGYGTGTFTEDGGSILTLHFDGYSTPDYILTCLLYTSPSPRDRG